MLQLLCMCKVLLQTRSSINSWTQIQKCKAWHWKAIKLTRRNGNSELRTSDCLKSSLPFSFIAFAADCASALDWPRTYQVVLRSNPKLLTESFKNIHLRSPFVPFESLQLDIEDVRWCSIFSCFTLLVWPTPSGWEGLEVFTLLRSSPHHCKLGKAQQSTLLLRTQHNWIFRHREALLSWTFRFDKFGFQVYVQFQRVIKSSKNGTAEFTAASLARDHIPNLSHNPHWLNTDFAFEPEHPHIILNFQPAKQKTNDLLICRILSLFVWLCFSLSSLSREI